MVRLVRPVRLLTLGENAIEIGETRLGPDAEMIFAALLVLALEAGRRIPRQELIQLLWPAVDDARARHCLRQTLYKLKQLGVAVDASAEGVSLAPNHVRADFHELEGRGAALAEVGEFLPGYAPALSAALTARLERYRGVACGHVRRALLSALAEQRKAARWADAEAVARRCLQLDPLNEEATLALAEATALAGNKAEALAILDRYTAEVSGGDGHAQALVRLQPAILRRRIAERIPDRRYGTAAESDFVGRDESMAYLHALLDEARSGRGRGCLLWGDAGIGKTRVATEFTDAAALRGARVQRVGCQPSDVHRPLSVFVDVVPSLLNVPGALGCSPESMGYLKRLTEHDRSSTTPSDASREAEFLYGRVRRALLDLVDAIAAECTLVLLVEDVHWLDAMSWSVLRELIEWGATRKLLVVMTSRTPKTDDDPPRWAGRPLDRHHLAPLPDGSTSAIVDSLLRGVPHPEVEASVRARWTHLADGNPLFARELVQQWLATGTADRLPGSLLSLVDARIARLSPPALRVLQAVAVLGKNATLERVDAVLEYRKHQLLEAIEELDTAGTLSASPRELRVRHELLADSALDRLASAGAQLLHRGAALALESEIDGPHSASVLWDCARHWQAAGVSERALSLASDRVAHLLNVGLPLEAASICDLSLEYCSSSGERSALLRKQCHALQAAGDWSRLLTRLRHLRETDQSTQSAPAHDDLELSELLAAYNSNHTHGPINEKVLGCVAASGASTSHRLQAALLAFVLAFHRADEAALHSVHGAIEHLLDREDAGQALSDQLRLTYWTMSGQWEKAVESARRLIDRERSISDPLRLSRALARSWNAFFNAGLVQEAESTIRESHDLVERTQAAGAVVVSCSVVLEHYLRIGDFTTAQHWYTRALEWASRGDRTFHSVAIDYQGSHLALALGQLDEAERRLANAASQIHSDSAFLRKLEGDVLLLRVDLERGRVPEISVIRDFQARLARAWWTGTRDFEVVTLRAALRAAGFHDEADSVTRDYLSRHRYGRSPLYFELELLSQELLTEQ